MIPGVTGVGGSPRPESAGVSFVIMLIIMVSMFMPDCMSVMLFSIVDILVWMVYLVLPFRLEALEALEALPVSIVTV